MELSIIENFPRIDCELIQIKIWYSSTKWSIIISFENNKSRLLLFNKQTKCIFCPNIAHLALFPPLSTFPTLCGSASQPYPTHLLPGKATSHSLPQPPTIPS